MKRRISKLTALLLSLTLALSLALPSLAFEDANPPLWHEWGYGSLEEALIETGMVRAEYEDLVSRELAARGWLAAHPEEAAAFDPYAYFAEEYTWYDSAQEYMDSQGLTQEDFEQKMQAEWVRGKLEDEKLSSWLSSHPEEAAAFDPYAYFAEEYDWYDSAQEYIDFWGLTQEEFEQKMLNSWARGRIVAEERDGATAAFKAEYAEECAAFDPYAYYEGGYYFDYFGTAQEYMELFGLTEEEFSQTMFQIWMVEFQTVAKEKERLGGSVRGINVMVDGKCVSFPDARPELVNGRTMVPLSAIMEHLEARVSYDQAAHSVQVSMDGLSFTHAIGSDLLALSDGSTVKMDVPSYIQDGRTMVPVRFFSEVLGYEVLWDSDYQTAVLLDRQGLTDSIDKDFTLLNRVLYAESAADQIKEGQTVEQTVRFDLDLTLFDTLHGDKNIPVNLSGSALVNDKAMELHFSGDLSSLIDYLENEVYLYLDSQEADQLRTALTGFSMDVILNLELGAVYFRCPALAGLSPEPMDPDAWMALPMDLSELSGLGLSFSGLSQPGTVGQIFAEAAGGTPFWLWNNALSGAVEIEAYVGDSQFTQSGDSYVISYEIEEYSWLIDAYTCTIEASITPVGDKSCTYSATLHLTSEIMAADAELTGSSGKADLSVSFHLKNTFKFLLDVNSRTSGSDQAPLSAPPAGSKIEFPAGPVGSGSM